LDYNKDKGSELFKKIYAQKKLAEDIYNARNDLGFTFVNDNYSAEENLVANLNSTALKAKSLDKIIEKLSSDEKKAQKALGIKPVESGSLEPEELTLLELNNKKKSEKEGSSTETRCKVCNRIFKSGGVAGMGPKCASILASWLDTNDWNTAIASHKKFKKISEISDGNLYPIMIVKEVKTNRFFPADILKRESDGRYLVVDLSNIGKNSTNNSANNDAKASMKEAIRVYLDENEHEVAQVFGDKKKQ